MEMGWLFLLFVVDVNHGDMQPRTVTRQVFQSERACNRQRRDAAREHRRNGGAERTFSVCIPQSVFADEGALTEQLGGPR